MLQGKEDEELKQDEMIEQRLFTESNNSNTNLSPLPSRNPSPDGTKKTHSSLFGALNSEEFNIVAENARLKQEVLMLKEQLKEHAVIVKELKDEVKDFKLQQKEILN